MTNIDIAIYRDAAIKYNNLVLLLFNSAHEEYEKYWTAQSDSEANARWNRYRGIASVIEESELREEFQLWQEQIRDEEVQ
ncbi:MAG: hypothetical protein LUE97_06350 [Oscillospiraceae bacterium]|nr:hypothetical protein [Oscillospiraceae bacterium]